MTPLRLYGESTCPHCASAVEHLKGLKLPVQTITVQTDPILQAGLQAVFNGSQKLPVLISMDTHEVIMGFQPEEYDKLAKFYRGESSASAVGQTPIEGQLVGQTPELALGETPKAEGIV